MQNLQSDLPLVLGDAGQLEQACLNVILNAAEAMPRGGVLAITSRTLRLPGATRRGEPGEEPSADSASASQADRSEPALDAPDRSPAAPSRKTATPLHVALDFQDTGPGMSDQQRRRAFSSVLSTTKAKGTGLGLAIVARIVETHRGRLKIKSRPGHGTTVSLILPCQYRA